MQEKTQSKEKIFTLATAISIIIGIFFYGVVISMFYLTPRDDVLLPYYSNFKRLTYIILAGSIFTAISVYRDSTNRYQHQHLLRALLFSLSSGLGAQIYFEEIREKTAKPVKYSFLYGTIATIFFVLVITVLLWYGSKVNGVNIF